MRPLVLAAIVFVCGAAQASGPDSGEWNFRVLLDGKPIGQHRFTLRTDGAQRELKSDARFDVKLLGISVYRYRHEAIERWTGDCLASLQAKTDDNGEALSMQASREGDALVVKATQASETLPGCTMSFAYWNPAMRQQTRLLNAQSGKAETVKVESLGDDKREVKGRAVEARHYRIVGTEQPVDLWYTPEGEWIGLEAKTPGGKRTLSYQRD